MSDRGLDVLRDGLRELVSELVAEELERRDVGPQWRTLEEAAERYRSTPGALRKRAERDQLPGAAKDGSRWLLDVAVYDRALASDTLGRHDKEGSRRGNGRARGTGGMSSHA